MTRDTYDPGCPIFSRSHRDKVGIVCASKRPLSLFAAILLALLTAAAAAQDNYLFAYFKEPGNQGFYLALSRDGYHYTALNDGHPWLATADPRPNPKEGEDMRDIFLTRAPDNTFRAVWTWNWRGNSFGTASSPNLLSWSPQKQVPIMQDFPAVNNVWAPETYWDSARKQWLIIWSSSMKEATGPEAGNRIWYSLTPDFITFSKPAIFFDPGYVVIDATIFHETASLEEDAPYRLIFKQQTYDPLTFQERVVTGRTLEGPWDKQTISGFLNESWSEGPSALRVGDKVIVFYDHYRAPRARFEAVATTDWKHWEEVSSQIDLPPNCKHGSFLKITDAEADRLLQRHDPPGR